MVISRAVVAPEKKTSRVGEKPYSFHHGRKMEGINQYIKK